MDWIGRKHQFDGGCCARFVLCFQTSSTSGSRWRNYVGKNNNGGGCGQSDFST